MNSIEAQNYSTTGGDLLTVVFELVGDSSLRIPLHTIDIFSISLSVLIIVAVEFGKYFACNGI